MCKGSSVILNIFCCQGCGHCYAWCPGEGGQHWTCLSFGKDSADYRCNWLLGKLSGISLKGAGGSGPQVYQGPAIDAFSDWLINRSINPRFGKPLKNGVKNL